MDITFPTNEGTFNFRVAAVMIHAGKVLMMQDSDAPYWYLPGGRVHVGETAETALLRELEEEVGICGKILRPLWLAQDFFHEVVNDEDYHEIGLYYLVDVQDSGLLERGETFVTREENQVNTFQWIPLDQLSRLFLRPGFLAQEICHLPEALKIIVKKSI